MKIKQKNFENLDRPFEQRVLVEVQTKAGKLALEFSPLPLGFYEQIEKRVKMPKPPRTGWLRDKKNRFARDDFGNLIAETDDQDPVYLDAKKIADRRQNTAMLYELLRTSPLVEFSQVDDGTLEFFDRVYEELVAAGMSSGQQLQIIRAANKVSGLDEEEIDSAKKN